MAGTGEERGRTYNIAPSDRPGIYDLSVSLYFPANDERLKTSGASTFKKDSGACNWDKVLADLNRTIKDTEMQIQRVTSIPLTSIEVKIPGIAYTGLIGRNVETNEEADILDYVGTARNANFKITETEKKNFEAKLVSSEGLNATVKFHFQARSRNGSVTAKIDSQNLAQNFSVAAAAKGLKYLGSADLNATLKSSVTSNAVRITSEAGTNEDLGKITNMLVDKILKEVGLAMTNVQLSEADKAKAGSGQIALAAIVEILKTKMSSEISFNLVSAPESASVQTETKLKTDRLNDPNVIEVKVSAGYTDPSLGIAINAGQSITITPVSWYLDEIEYKESRSYLTYSEILLLNLGGVFDDVLNEKMKINDVTINGTRLAEGKWNLAGIASPNKYRWARVQSPAEPHRKASNIILPNVKSFGELPIYVTFSELGDSRFIKLSELLESENPYYKAVYNDQTGRLILTAKQNLGTIRIRERLRGPENIITKPVILDQVFQQKTNLFNNSEYTGRLILKEDKEAIVKQKTVVLFIGRPRVMNTSELKLFSQITPTLPLKP